jgi:hypothetical protein
MGTVIEISVNVMTVDCPPVFFMSAVKSHVAKVDTIFSQLEDQFLQCNQSKYVNFLIT